MEPLTCTVPDVAVVFEGGGMRAAYTSAVVETLLANDLHLGWAGGISAGSSLTCNYVTRDIPRTRRAFVSFVVDPQFGGVRTFLRGKGIFNAEYIYEQTSGPDEALPFDWETWQASPTQVGVGGFCAETGEYVCWGRDDMPDLRSLLRRVRASSTLPGLMPAVEIDGQHWMDGALGPTGGFAIDGARADGFERFFVVLTQPRDYVKKAVRPAAAYRAYWRKYPAVADALLVRHERYNETREQIFEWEREGKALVFAPEVIGIGRGSTRFADLRAAYEAGLEQSRRELPRWREWLGASARG